MNYNNTNNNSVQSQIYSYKDILQVNDIKGTNPRQMARSRNFGQDEFLGQQIQHHPQYKNRMSSLGLKIRNPLFNDYYYKNDNNENQFQNPSSYYKSPATAKPIMYGASQQILNYQKSPPQTQQGKLQQNQPILDLSKNENLRFKIPKIENKDYPYGRCPDNYSVGVKNLGSQKRTDTYQSNFGQNFSSIYQAPGYDKEQFQSQIQQQQAQQNKRSQSQVNLKNQFLDQNQNWQNVQQEGVRNSSVITNNINNIQGELSRETNFFNNQNNQRPNIKQDIAKAENKAGIQQQYEPQQYQQNQQFNAATQNQILNQQNQNQNKSNMDKIIQYSDQQGPLREESRNSIYHENFGYKNISNRYIQNNSMKHIPRDSHIYNTKPYQDSKQISNSNYMNNNQNIYQANEQDNEQPYDARRMYNSQVQRNKEYKPLNIISMKRHQQFLTQDNPNWKQDYDRQQFSQWNGSKQDIKNLIKEKNVRMQNKTPFSTSNGEYGV
ncbi:hypothetical protein PPERSA_10781 [Pseudocohnilembus persalinus]|uniref:Uncharacterized protein n=1 Tax=Pseudocohnilembus persalinus TaxID=266149 RepID=A0A0V0QDJ8_PSEPJ|nr:hypothetical protein PPERSA_10781 [Pseudocohnilembus persalinus]|eukprot:KRX00282.1 hypothetical protein PPERSA_10781 [Pseudocohnilembus persalinus]